MCYNVKHTTGKLHDAERMFESLMRSPRVHQMSERKLMYVTQSLEWSRVEDLTFVTVQTDKHMNWISDFVIISTHRARTPNPG